MQALTRLLGSFQAPEVTPEQEERAREFEERERRAGWKRRIDDAGIPSGFRHARPSEAHPSVQAWIAAFGPSTSRGLLLWGGWGAGKTHSGCAALIQCARTRTVRYLSLPDLVREARTFRRDALDQYLNAGVLLLDDMGRESRTQFAAEQVFAMADYRCHRGKPTIITTNYDAAGLVAHYSEAADESTANAIMSRIGGMCEAVRFEGPDRRLS